MGCWQVGEGGRGSWISCRAEEICLGRCAYRDGTYVHAGRAPWRAAFSEWPGTTLHFDLP